MCVKEDIRNFKKRDADFFNTALKNIKGDILNNNAQASTSLMYVLEVLKEALYRWADSGLDPEWKKCVLSLFFAFQENLLVSKDGDDCVIEKALEVYECDFVTKSVIKANLKFVVKTTNEYILETKKTIVKKIQTTSN